MTDPNFVQLASLVTGPWAQVVQVWEEFRVAENYLLRADVGSAARQDFLYDALWAAHGRGHLAVLAVRLAGKNLIEPLFDEKVQEITGQGFAMQAYVNGAWRPQLALPAISGVIEACDHVCHIAIDDQHRGTGVLIQPNIVATAAHVIAPLIDAAGKAQPGSVGRLRLRFYDANQLLKTNDSAAAPVEARLDQDWLAYYSPRAPGEGLAGYAVNSVAGIHATTGPWDLALILLTEPPRAGLKGHTLHANLPPAVKFGVHVLHHPADAMGQPTGLLWSIGSIVEELPTQAPLRWLHDANTDHGSSGAPCFDDRWRVVALHQAGPGQVRTANQVNRAVPIYPWANQINALAARKDRRPVPGDLTGEDGKTVGVIGRERFQDRVWSGMSPTVPVAQQVTVVVGDPGTGKTFSGAILRELGRLAGSMVITFDVRNAQGDDAISFARKLVGAFGKELAADGAIASSLTTQLRDLRNEILPTLMRELEALCRGAPVWLFLDGFEDANLSTTANTPQLIELLLENLASAPSLRVVLTGWKGTVLPDQLELLSPQPSGEEIAERVWRDLAPPGSRAPPQQLANIVPMVNFVLSTVPPGAPYERAMGAVRILKPMMTGVVQTAQAGAGGI